MFFPQLTTVTKMFGFGPQIAKLLRHNQIHGISNIAVDLATSEEIGTAQASSLLELDTISNATEDEERIFELLDKADGIRDGQIETKNLLKWVKAMDLNNTIDMEANLNITPYQLERLLSRADENKDGFFDKVEFIRLLRNHDTELTKVQLNLFKQYLSVAAYAEEVTFCPPPIFIPSIVILEVVIFVFHLVHFRKHHPQLPITWNGPEPVCSNLILDPNKRSQIWRFISYSLVHSGVQHIFFNVIMQLFVGLPLEMTHRTIRVAVVYLAGVLAGSLGSSIVDPHVFLAGASGGVYALMAAHLATLILNWREDIVIINKRFRRNKATSAKHGHIIRALRLCLVLTYGVVDTGMAIFLQNARTSYVAHLSGAIVGVLIGIIVLKNRKVEHWERKLKMVCVAMAVAIMSGAFLWNIFADVVVKVVRGKNATYFGFEQDPEFQRSCHDYI